MILATAYLLALSQPARAARASCRLSRTVSMALNPEMRNTSAVMGCREQKASFPAQALSALTSPRMPRKPAELMYSTAGTCR